MTSSLEIEARKRIVVLIFFLYFAGYGLWLNAEEISGNYGNLDCATEYIHIYPGPYPMAPGKEKFCGQSSERLANYTLPRSARSVFIEYHSANFNPNSTFEVHIKANYSVCGGTLEHPIFEFSSPSNGSQYPNNIECIWDISTGIGYHIGLSFINRFFLEDSTNCTKDYIEIYDFDDDWKVLSRVCGRSTPKPFNSTGNRMRIIFRTNENTVGEGFTVKWEENCGGIFSVTKASQILTSPNYPNKYPRNLKCNYTLLAGKEDYINVDFTEFELEDTSRACVYDNLTIYKYEDWSYPPNAPVLVGTYCWKRSLNHIRHKHKINLIFSSDAFIEKKGFYSNYYLDNCGGNVTNSSMIEVPQKEAGKYADYLTCLWYIKAPESKKIVIRFEYFDLEHNDMCYLDSVEVFQGSKTDPEQRKAMLCGNLTQHAPIININSNNAVVKFHSDGNVNHRGFKALVLFGENCDKTIELNDRSTSYKLDKIDTFYPPLLDCHYVITVPEGYVIKIEFDHFHLAPCRTDNSSCTCDYVALLDGSDAFAEPIQKNLCGHSLPQSVTTSGRSLYIRYVTDSVLSSSGFSATIKMETAECGKTIIRLNSTTPEHTITWPIGSSSYHPNSQCDWIIEAPDMEQVDIHFEKFELEDADSSGQCSLDFLRLTDEDANLFNSEGLGSGFVFSGGKSRVLKPYFYWGRSFPSAPHDYCGSGIPNDFVSSSKRVKVRFRSNESIQKSGFQFLARMTPACHRNYTSLQGRLYTKTIKECETHITVPENYTISLYFGIFNIYLTDFSFQCTDETAPIRIFDSRSNRLLQRVCPGSIPNPIFANTSSVMIKTRKMDMSWVDTNGAYDITYLATDAGLGCGGQIFNYAGQFSSPMYPANDRNASECRWDISVPQNLVVSLTFTVFDMGTSVHCSDNYLQIIETDYEGKETIARKYCGEDLPSAYKSNRNVVSIKFKKTSNFAGTGWNLQFMAVHPSAVVT